MLLFSWTQVAYWMFYRSSLSKGRSKLLGLSSWLLRRDFVLPSKSSTWDKAPGAGEVGGWKGGVLGVSKIIFLFWVLECFWVLLGIFFGVFCWKYGASSRNHQNPWSQFGFETKPPEDSQVFITFFFFFFACTQARVLERRKEAETLENHLWQIPRKQPQTPRKETEHPWKVSREEQEHRGKSMRGVECCSCCKLQKTDETLGRPLGTLQID